MRKTRHHRRNFRNRSRKQRGGYDKATERWVQQILDIPYFNNWSSHQNEEFPKISIDPDATDGQTSLEEVSRHIKFIMPGIKTPGAFNQMLLTRRNDSTFQTSIDYMMATENYLRAQVQSMRPVTSLTDKGMYPLLIWTLLASAPEGPIRPILEESQPSAQVLQ
jgi:hypothetical protein